MRQLTRGGYAERSTSVSFKTGSWRVQRPLHRHRAAPCHAACPAGEDAQAYLAKVAEGRLREAWEEIVSANPLPSITGRVCHHPCESDCNRSQYDAPISIQGVERFLGDKAIAEGWPYPVAPVAAHALAVAVIGAGPAGLSAAYHLLRRGYRVTLFDSLPEAGGTCRSAIPAYRLPREVLDAELERVLTTGMTLRLQHRLGRDVSLQELRSDFDAMFLAPGTQRSRAWNVDGVTQRDLQMGQDLLKKWTDIGAIPTPNKAAIVGGGNTAVDLSRVLKRAGIPEVHIITHEAIPGPGIEPECAMPAIPREIAQAREEGVIIHENRGIRRLILRGERVVGIEMVHMRKLRRANGKLERVAFEGTETVLHVDQVIPAVGQEVDTHGFESLLVGTNAFRVDGWGRVENNQGVFAGGDACPGRGTVSAAVGDGRRAAHAIDAYLRESELDAVPAPEPIGLSELNLNYYEPASRPQHPVLPVEQRTAFEEIEGGLNSNEITVEAKRCFSCGNCFACDNCWTLCPDSSVLKTSELASDGSHYVFDYDYCKGCGICAHECPAGFIAMVDEP
ncbi:MAG: glutamate synthase [Gammaproteobacteria bacterium SG8_47]|nr:MAG: glutamate synthase [Gammaproteobacteria bacterium SG8_47]